MFLPNELLGKISQQLRSSNYRDKPEELRREENANLANLALVNRQWRLEATRLLWSDIEVPLHYQGLEAKRVGDRLFLINEKYYNYVLSLTITDPSSTSWPAFRESYVIYQTRATLSRVRALQHLTFQAHEDRRPELIERLYSCIFPSLSSLLLHIRSSRTIDHNSVFSFLRQHSSLTSLDLNVKSVPDFWPIDDEPISPIPWKELREKSINLLPNLRHFWAPVDQAMLLSQTMPLRVCALSNEEEVPQLLREQLTSLDGPFPYLRNLSIKGTQALLDRPMIELLAVLAPNVRRLRGFRVEPEFLVSFHWAPPPSHLFNNTGVAIDDSSR